MLGLEPCSHLQLCTFANRFICPGLGCVVARFPTAGPFFLLPPQDRVFHDEGQHLIAALQIGYFLLARYFVECEVIEAGEDLDALVSTVCTTESEMARAVLAAVNANDSAEAIALVQALAARLEPVTGRYGRRSPVARRAVCAPMCLRACVGLPHRPKARAPILKRAAASAASPLPTTALASSSPLPSTRRVSFGVWRPPPDLRC